MARSRKKLKQKGRMSNFLGKPTIIVTYAYNDEAGGWVAVLSRRGTMVDMLLGETLTGLVEETLTVLGNDYVGEKVAHTIDRTNTTMEDQTLIATYLASRDL